jgi:hypothetical protein
VVASGVVVALAAFIYFSTYCDDSLFQSDAADYLRAAEGGFVASYFDTRSVGLWGTIALVKAHPEVRPHIWDFLDRENDAAAARHFHVAPGFYGAVLARSMNAGNRTQRLIMAGTGAAAIGILWAGLLMASVPWWAAAGAAILAVLTPAINLTSTDISPHAPFMASLLACGFALARYLESRARLWGVLTGISLALCVATCELSLVVLVAFSLVLGWAVVRHGARAAAQLVATPLLVFFASLAILWPAGVLKGSYALSYGVFVFQALFRSHAYFGHAGPVEGILRGMQGSYLVLAVAVIVALAAGILVSSRRATPYLPVMALLTLGFFGQGVLNRFQNATYAAHFAVLLWALFAITVKECLLDSVGMRRRATVSALALALVLTGAAATRWPAAVRRDHEMGRRMVNRAGEAIEVARHSIPRGQTVLTNALPEMWRLYLPGPRVEESASPSTLEPKEWVSMPEDYWIIADPVLLTAAEEHSLEPGEITTVAGFILSHVQPSPR